MPDFLVITERVGQPVLAVPRGDLHRPEPNLAPELLSIPGVFGHSRATDAMEPSIRGLGFDRVSTTFNGVPLVNASPERTYSPVAVLGPVPLGQIVVWKALPSVTLGPATTGGRITLATTMAEAGQPDGNSGQLTSTYYGGRGGHVSLAHIQHAAGPWYFAAAGFVNDLGDYRAPDGRIVAARMEDSGASATVGWRNDAHNLQLDLLHRRLRRQDAVSLPLDGRDSESQLFTLTDHWKCDSGVLQEISWRFGGSRTDPNITSLARPVPILIYAQALARTLGGGLTTVWRTAADDTLTLGADHAYQNRSAIRTTPSGRDYIWPDVTYTDTGVFSEWNHRFDKQWKLRLGARVDTVHSNARAADQPALGRPVREQYVLYNGAAAAVVPRSDQVGAANILFTRQTGIFTTYFGVGFSKQPAQVMERYRAFLNALGGDGRGGNAVELGNPGLAAERNWALEAGGNWRHPTADLEASCYFYRVNDFIHRTTIGITLPPLAPMTVFGYRNISAEFYGGELGLTLKPTPRWRVPLTLAIAEARNRRTGIGLAEIPPWEATAAVRVNFTVAARSCQAELGTRLVGHSDNPALLENPLYGHAGGFALWHLRTLLPLGRRFHVEVGIENLLNHTYTEYLTPPVGPFRPASGDLLPGQRIPGPRRAVWVSATWQL